MSDLTRGTVGWFALGVGTLGVTEGQTFRVSVVNVGPQVVTILCGIWQNPNLRQESFTLQPGESKDCDLKASDIPKELFDKAGRAQIRPFMRCSDRAVCGNVEVFDDKTGRTRIALALQDLGRSDATRQGPGVPFPEFQTLG